VTHGIWGADDKIGDLETVWAGEDETLGKILENNRPPAERRRWKLVRYPEPFPSAWVSKRARQIESRRSLLTNLAFRDLEDEAWFLSTDRPAEARNDSSGVQSLRIELDGEHSVGLDLGPSATRARVIEWNGRSGTVEHDGSCVLVLRRANFPGWMVRINGGPERPVSRVNGGIQGIVLTGRGPSRVETVYRPTHLRESSAVSAASTGAALLVLAALAWRRSGRSDV
jgi:hypothetical protein